MVNYTIELLKEIETRDNAKILDEKYEKISRNIDINFECKCGTIYSRNFRLIVENSGMCCKECTKKNKSEKRKQTTLEKYGVEHISHCDKIKEKRKQTTLEKYGVEYNVLSEEVKEKIKKTNLERYSVENVFQSDEIKEKIKQTNLEKYGVENVSQLDEIKEKVKKTNLERYGAEHVNRYTKNK